MAVRTEHALLPERISWSWRAAWEGYALARMFAGFCIGLVAGALAYFGTADDSSWHFWAWTCVGVAVGVLWGVTRGLVFEQIERKETPYQGLQAAAANVGRAIGIVWVVAGFVLALVTRNPLLGLAAGFQLSIAMSPLFGSVSVAQAIAFQSVLARYGHLPKRIETRRLGFFYEYCTEIHLLRKSANGRYAFPHILLQEYFARYKG